MNVDILPLDAPLPQAVNSLLKVPVAVLDRDLYYAEDAFLHAVIVFAETRVALWGYRVDVMEGAQATPATVGPLPTAPHAPRIELKLELAPLATLTYRLRVTLLDQAGTLVETLETPSFEVLATRRRSVAPALPEPLTLENFDGTPWPVTLGIPFAEGQLDDDHALVVQDRRGRRVEAQVETISRWHPAPGGRSGVRWVRLDFVAREPSYQLVAAPRPAPSLTWVDTSSPDRILVSGDEVAFAVFTHAFAGISELKRRVQGAWVPIAGQPRGPYLCVEAFFPATSPAAGRLTEAYFEARLDANVQVEVEQLGPVAVTIVARGEYVYAGGGLEWETTAGRVAIPTGERVGRFVTRITAFRELAQVHVSHRSILSDECGNTREDLAQALRRDGSFAEQEITDSLGNYVYDAGEPWKRPVDIGWELGLEELQAASLGWERAGCAETLTLDPWPAARMSVHQFAHDACSLIVDTTDLITGARKREVRRVKDGRRAEGWVAGLVAQDRVALTLALRDIWQKFPKELSALRDDTGAPAVAVHLWPRHGRTSVGSEDAQQLFVTGAHEPNALALSASAEALRAELYKLPWAHSGRALDLRVPARFFAQLLRARQLQGVSGFEDRDTLDVSELREMVSRTAQGLAVASEFALFMDPAPLPTAEALASVARRRARLWQSAPFAHPSARWNADSGVEGDIASAAAVQEPAFEAAHRAAVRAIERTVVDAAGAYGMWIYGDIHDGWVPSYPALAAGRHTMIGVPDLHRVWSASHYRSVWTAWLHYFRSGDPDLLRWAWATSDHYLDVNTYRSSTPQPYHRGAGDMAHCYGVTPWGSPGDVSGHFIDPDASRLRYCLSGDGWARETYELWWREFLQRGGLGGDFREGVTSLGAVTTRYLHTRDPLALLITRLGARALFNQRRTTQAPPSFSFTGLTPDHPVWHRQWLSHYHQLTGDRDAVRFASDWLDFIDALPGEVPLGPAAFAIRVSKSAADALRALNRLRPELWDKIATVLHRPDALYDGYGTHALADAARWLQEAPYFLHEARQVGLRIEPAPQPTSPPATERQGRSTYPERRQGTAKTRVYVLVPAATPSFSLRIALLSGENIVSRRMGLLVRRFVRGTSTWQTVITTLSWPQTVATATPVDELINHGTTLGEALHEITTTEESVPLLAPLSSFPEVYELWGAPSTSSSDDAGRLVSLYGSYLYGRHDWFVAPAHGAAREYVLVLEANDDRGRRNTPHFVSVRDALGASSQPRKVSPPPKPIGPWSYEYPRLGPRADLGTALPRHGSGYQLFRPTNDPDLTQVGFSVTASSAAPARLFVAGDRGAQVRLEHGDERLLLAEDSAALAAVVAFIQTFAVPLAALA